MDPNRVSRRAALGLFGTAVLGLAGCVSLPSTSAPKVIDTFSPRASNVDVPAPTPNQEPDLLVRDFIRASALTDQRHAAARQFLTPEAAESWDDSASTNVVLRVDLNSIATPSTNTAEFTLRAQRLGDLTEGGVFSARDGEYSTQITLQRVDGQWRISDLPDGVVMERTDFFSNYSVHNLYFFDTRARNLVPDPRWSRSYQDDLAFAMLNLIAAGPRPSLESGVTTRIPTSVAVRPGEGDGNEGTVIDFQGLPPMTSTTITEFAAQVVWTLSSAGVRGPYLLESGGAPIDDRHAAGWTVEDVASYNPYPDQPPLEYALTSADGVVRLTGGAAQTVGGPWAAISDTRYARLSPSGERIALVAGDGASPEDTVLSVGTLTDGPQEMLRGRRITAPTWNRTDDSLWFLADGEISWLSNINDPASAAAVDTSRIGTLSGEITDMALDPTGVRLFFVAGESIYLTTVERDDVGQPYLGPAQVIGQTMSGTVTSVGWRDRDTMMIGRSVLEAPVVTISVDGLLAESLSGRNITAPIDAVGAAGGMLFALDQRSLLQLSPDADEATRYWREVSGLAGIRAFPVVRG